MKHFINLVDLSTDDIWTVLNKATELKKEWQAGGNKPILKGKILAMVFQKPSLRTRVSFDVGMLHLGGNALYLSPAEIGLGGRESVPDVARVLSGYVDGIMARTFSHTHMAQLAEYASVPVINGLSDFNHPCQAMGDFLTILEYKESLDGLKLTFVGDGNNVARSLMFVSAKLGVDFTIATPPGYEMEEKYVAIAQKAAAESGASLEFLNDPITAVTNSDVIYTDVWTSMGQEEESKKRLAVFPPYQINDELVAHAKADAIVMHCLPAHRGEEITDSAADGPQSVLFPQAANRLHAQKGILALLMNNE
ncbi:MAG TPA: ornithine carbamoyltransferase [Chloroflexi bacterium]|nr:ornithine carbamoyltransferase [Chloroflexota bacterium]